MIKSKSNRSRLAGGGTEVRQGKLLGQRLGNLTWFLEGSPRGISSILLFSFIAVLLLKKHVEHWIRLELVQQVGPLNAILVRSSVAGPNLRIERTLRLRRSLISVADAILRKCCNAVSPWSGNHVRWQTREHGNHWLLNRGILVWLILKIPDHIWN